MALFKIIQHSKDRFYSWVIKRYKDHLETQINRKKFDPELSLKLDALSVLIGDREW